MESELDHAGDVFVMGVAIDCTATELLYLWWHLCGRPISGAVAEMAMVRFYDRVTLFVLDGTIDTMV